MAAVGPAAASRPTSQRSDVDWSAIEERAKRASALVWSKYLDTPVAAVCVDPAGLFVLPDTTHGEMGAQQTLQIVLNSGRPDQRVLHAKWLRDGSGGTPALVRAIPSRDSDPAPAGPPGAAAARGGAGDAAGDPAVGRNEAFDWLPLGTLNLPAKPGSSVKFPVLAVSYRGGVLNSDERREIVRKLAEHTPEAVAVRGQSEWNRFLDGCNGFVKVDRPREDWFQGGPIVNEQGRLVGFGPPSRYNRIMSVETIASVLATPEVVFVPPPIRYEELARPREFVVRIMPGEFAGQHRLVELTLSTGRGDERTTSAPAPAGNGAFHFSAVPLPPGGAPPAQIGYRVTVRNADQREQILQQVAGFIPVDGLPVALQSAANQRVLDERGRLELPLRSPARSMRVAGSGRFLVLQLPARGRVEVFDTTSLGFTASVSAADALIAAGAEKLLVVFPGQRLMQRWDLATGQREASAPLPWPYEVYSAAMGSAAVGPLVLGTSSGLRVIDVDTLKAVEVPELVPSPESGISRGPPGKTGIAASADGATYLLKESRATQQPVTLVTLHGTVAKVQWELRSDPSVEYALPSDDGTTVMSSFGLRDLSLRTFDDAAVAMRTSFTLPCGDRTPFLIAFPQPAGIAGQTNSQVKASVYDLGGRAELFQLPVPEEMSFGINYPRDTALRSDERIRLIPSADLMATLPVAADRLVIRRVRMEAELKKAGREYFYFRSHPVRSARRGGTYTYTPDARSSRGPAHVRVVSGPEGMRADPTGAITWAVPAAAEPSTGEPVSVILSAKDEADREVFQSFDIHVH
jgi:hypothetical protein